MASHALATADPSLARMLGHVLVDYLANRKGYESAARSYIKFCSLRGLPPFPADGIKLAAWLVRIASHVKHTSMKVYLAAVHYQQVLEGMPWEVIGYDHVRNALHWVRRTFPCDPKGAKFAVTLSLLRRLFPFLAGWPHLASMSHEDRLFAAASWIAVMSFFRGGEFLSSPGSKRAILTRSAIRYAFQDGSELLVTAVPQPKATCWLPTVDVPCYGGVDPVFHPVVLWRAYDSGSPVAHSAPPQSVPAFHLSDGSALTKAWLTKRTASLCTLAGVELVDDLGKALSIKMASWRAGAVRSAMDAKPPISEPIIMELGRWKSIAWRSYFLHSAIDVQGAAQGMCLASAAPCASPERRVVMVPETGSMPSVAVLDGAVKAMARSSSKPPSQASPPQRIRRAPKRFR